MLFLFPTALNITNVTGSLHLKSATANPSSLNDSGSTALVCSYDQTFEVRQVQSSNILYVLEPFESALADEYGVSPPLSVQAIGQCKALLELVSVPANAAGFLKQALPTYTASSADPESVDASNWKGSKRSLLLDAPCSVGEFVKAWTQLCGFETQNQAWRPSPDALRIVWTSIFTAATMKGINLTKPFEGKVLLNLAAEDGHPEQLAGSVLKRLASEDEDPMEGCECGIRSVL